METLAKLHGHSHCFGQGLHFGGRCLWQPLQGEIQLLNSSGGNDSLLSGRGGKSDSPVDWSLDKSEGTSEWRPQEHR